MTDLLIRIKNASQLLQRSLAVAILAIAILIAGALLSYIVSVFLGIYAEIQEGREQLAQWQAVITRAENIVQTVSDSAGSTPYLSGDNTSLVQATLRQSVSDIASRSGASIASMSDLPIRLTEGVPLVRVRIQLDAPLASMQNLVLALESAAPGLVIEEAQIRRTNSTSQDILEAPLQLSAQLDIVGAADPAKIKLAEQLK